MPADAWLGVIAVGVLSFLVNYYVARWLNRW